MSMKQELETWVSALAHYDRNEFEESIKSFEPIADTSKILFNCGIIRATLGEHEEAVKYYQQAVALDQYLAIAYFQAGVSNFLVGDFEEALANFNDTLLYLRGNKKIEYEQLGLNFKLYACEALFNRGLCYVYLQALDTGLQDMIHATKEKAVDNHNVIDEAIKEQAEGYTVFSIPVGVVFRPSDAKVKNVRARDYLGKTQVRLVASGQPNAGNTSHRRNVSADTWAKDDRPTEKISYAATHLVRPNLVSRGGRQQSEPPIHRNLFPATPPLDSSEERRSPSVRNQTVEEEPESHTRASPPPGPPKLRRTSTEPLSVPQVGAARSHSASRAPRPNPIELGAAAFDRSSTARSSSQQRQQDLQQNHPARRASPPRRGTARSASERPAERRLETLGQGRFGDRNHERERSRERGPDHHYANDRQQQQRRPSASSIIPDRRPSASSERGNNLFGQISANEHADDVGARLKGLSVSTSFSPVSAHSPGSNPGSASASASATTASPSSSRSGGSLASRQRRENRDRDPNRDRRGGRPHSIEEADEDDAAANNNTFVGRGPEVLTDARRPSHAASLNSLSQSQSQAQVSPGATTTLSPTTTTTRRSSTLKSLRVKVHCADDTRYIIFSPSVSYNELVKQVAKKFALSNSSAASRSPTSPAGGQRSSSRSGTGSSGVPKVKIRTKDEEGDMITLGDQDDLDFAVGVCEAVARREGAGNANGEGVGRLELWVQAL